MAAHQMHEFLRRRYMSAAAVAMLQRHGATSPDPVRFRWASAVDPQLGRAVRLSQTFNRPPTGFADQAFVANIDAAAAHDVVPGFGIRTNAQPPIKVARDLKE